MVIHALLVDALVMRIRREELHPDDPCRIRHFLTATDPAALGRTVRVAALAPASVHRGIAREDFAGAGRAAPFASRARLATPVRDGVRPSLRAS
jgi:hypothetical protein